MMPRCSPRSLATGPRRFHLRTPVRGLRRELCPIAMPAVLAVGPPVASRSRRQRNRPAKPRIKNVFCSHSTQERNRLLMHDLSQLSSVRGLIVGAGAHGRVVLAIWKRSEPDRSLFFLDDNPELWGRQTNTALVLGSIEDYLSRSQDSDRAIIAVGYNAIRVRLANALEQTVQFANVIDPTAALLPGAALGRGILLGPQAVVHTGAHIADHVIVNTGAIVEHDCVVQEGANLSPGVRMAGRVRVDRLAFLGTGVTVAPRTHIGEGAIVGAGAVVVKDLPPRTLAYGVPARVVRPVTERDWNRLF